MKNKEDKKDGWIEKKEGGIRWCSRRKGTSKRECFVCGCCSQINAPMHGHACSYCVNTHASVECARG